MMPKLKHLDKVIFRFMAPSQPLFSKIIEVSIWPSKLKAVKRAAPNELRAKILKITVKTPIIPHKKANNKYIVTPPLLL